MPERIQHPTTTDVREHLDRIEEVIGGIRAYLCMFDARPENGISERIVEAFREIQVDAGGGARCQQAVSAWATELSAAVGADVAALPEQGDLLAPPPFTDGLMGIFGATAELADRDDYRSDHPFPIDPDEEVQW